jgi:ribosomal protein S18 acetylase RimI-like enzyme
MSICQLMSIRKAELLDAKGIAQVHVAAWKSAYRGLLPDNVLDRLAVDDVERRWKERIAKPWGHIFVVEKKDRLVGFVACGGSQDEDIDQDKVGEIYVLYVHPEEWRRGYGTVLLDKAIGRLRGDGVEKVILWVLRGNELALGFYEAAGFEADGASRVKQRVDGLEMPIVRYCQSIG